MRDFVAINDKTGRGMMSGCGIVCPPNLPTIAWEATLDPGYPATFSSTEGNEEWDGNFWKACCLF